MPRKDRMSKTLTPTFVGAFLALIVLGTGCSRGDRDAESVREQYARFVDLSGARRSADTRLRTEIDRILDEGSTPAQLQRKPRFERQNDAPGLVELFNPESLADIRERTDKLIPDSRFTFNRLKLEAVLQFTERNRELLRAIDTALQQPTSEFSVDFRHGFSAKADFIEVVEACVDAKALQAAGLLGEGDPIDAIPVLRSMFRLVERLSEVPHVSSRLAAIPLRATTFRVVEAAASHPKIQRSDLVALSALVRGHLEHWPDDATAWIGDRAMVLHSYEMIRAGLLFDLLTTEELQSFAKEGDLQYLAVAIRKSVDNDELYYLTAMRKILDACALPYHQREPVFAALYKDLDAKRDSSDFPLAAAYLFLADVRQGHRFQAQDRALAETWALALAMAAELKPPDIGLNPVSGRPYLVTREPTRVIVWTGDPNDSRIIVPRPSLHSGLQARGWPSLGFKE